MADKGLNFTISGVNNAQGALNSFDQGLNRVRNTLGKSGPLMSSWNRGLNENRRAIQQAGFQVADLAVQIGGGQNAILALTQQGSQMLQFFGSWGSVMAAVLAVGGSLLIFLMKSGIGFHDFKQEAEDAKKALGEFKSEMSGYIEAVNIVSAKTADLDEKFGRFGETIRKNAQLSAAIHMTEAQGKLNAAVSGMLGPLQQVSDAQKQAAESARAWFDAQAMQKQGLADPSMVMTYADAYLEMRDRVDELASSLGLTAPVAIQAKTALDALASAKGPEEIVARAQEAITLFSAMATSSGTIAPQLTGVVDALIQIEQQAALAAVAEDKMVLPMVNIIDLTNSAREAMVALASSEPGAGWLDGAIAKVQTLATAAWNAAQAAAALADKPFQTGSGALTTRTELFGNMGGRGLPTEAGPYQIPIEFVPASMKGGKGGGGEGVKEALSDIEKEAKKEAERIKSIFEDVASSISSSLLTGFKAVAKGTMSLKEYALDVLNSILDKALDVLLSPVFDAVGNSIAGMILGAFGTPKFSFAGGGHTGNGPRTGGMDGQGGFLAMMHPQESVIDWTRVGKGSGRQFADARQSSRSTGAQVIQVHVTESEGFAAKVNVLAADTSVKVFRAGIERYDRHQLPSSVQRVSNSSRVR